MLFTLAQSTDLNCFVEFHNLYKKTILNMAEIDSVTDS